MIKHCSRSIIMSHKASIDKGLEDEPRQTTHVSSTSAPMVWQLAPPTILYSLLRRIICDSLCFYCDSLPVIQLLNLLYSIQNANPRHKETSVCQTQHLFGGHFRVISIIIVSPSFNKRITINANQKRMSSERVSHICDSSQHCSLNAGGHRAI